MDVLEAITAMTGRPGVTGNETAVSEVVKEYYEAYADEIWVDRVGNTYARIGDRGPTLLVMAHMDEVGMMVNGIEENGMLRICGVAGVDPRVLPGSEVVVHGSRPLPAVIGALPPHLQSGGDQEKAYRIEELICDTGLCAAEVREIVRVGDNVTFNLLPPMPLKNQRIAGKSLDDRSCIAVMLETMELLKKRRLDCQVIFCASVQEEFMSLGAMTGSWTTRPDMAIALDVCHAPTPGVKPLRATELEKVGISIGGNIHPKLFELIRESADGQNIDWDYKVAAASTGTDAWHIQTQLGGIPCGLISLPLRYMHTSVEVISLRTLRNCAKVLAGVAAGLGADWEEKLCLDD